jgi:hypothetical protein
MQSPGLVAFFTLRRLNWMDLLRGCSKLGTLLGHRHCISVNRFWVVLAEFVYSYAEDEEVQTCALFAWKESNAALGLLLQQSCLWVSFWRRRSSAWRRCVIEAYERLNRSVGWLWRTAQLHISLGRGNFFTARGGSALAGLAMLRRLAERTSVSDRPPIVTSGDASLAILSQDTLQSGYRAAGAEEQYRFTTGRLTGLTPFSYAAGALSTIHDEKVLQILSGDLGAEAALLAEATDRRYGLIAASDDLPRSPYFLLPHKPIDRRGTVCGRRYVGAGSSHEASLHVQIFALVDHPCHYHWFLAYS